MLSTAVSLLFLREAAGLSPSSAERRVLLQVTRARGCLARVAFASPREPAALALHSPTSRILHAPKPRRMHLARAPLPLLLLGEELTAAWFLLLFTALSTGFSSSSRRASSASAAARTQSWCVLAAPSFLLPNTRFPSHDIHALTSSRVSVSLHRRQLPLIRVAKPPRTSAR